jgi:cell division inhibitor SepF
MGAWRKAGVWLGLVEDDDDGAYDDELDDDYGPVRDDFAVPARTRSIVRPQRGVDHDRLERDRLERGRRVREPRSGEYGDEPTARGGFAADRGRHEPYGAERARGTREPMTVRSEADAPRRSLRPEPEEPVRPLRSETDDALRRLRGEPDDPPRTLRELRTERASDPAESRAASRPTEPAGGASGTRPATVRPLLRPTAGSTALSLPAEEELEVAPQVQLRERAAATDEAAGRRYEITTLHPTSYNEARAIGEQFRDGHPVIMNLTEMDEPDAKRLVDFAAGLAFGLRGSMDRVTNRVFLLTPPNIRVSDEEKKRIAESGHGPA